MISPCSVVWMRSRTMEEDLAQFLRDVEDEGGADMEQVCRICGTKDTSRHPYEDRLIHFPRINKCEWCHVVHMLLYGEVVFTDSRPQFCDSFARHRVQLCKHLAVEAPDPQARTHLLGRTWRHGPQTLNLRAISYAGSVAT